MISARLFQPCLWLLLCGVLCSSPALRGAVRPVEGRDVYRHFVLPVPNDQRRYVKAWEFRPHSRAVHHAFLRVDRTGEGRRRDAADLEPGFPGMDTPTGIQSP